LSDITLAARIWPCGIDGWKNRCVAADQCAAFEASARAARVSRLYAQYNARLITPERCDFGISWLGNVVSISRPQPDVAGA